MNRTILMSLAIALTACQFDRTLGVDNSDGGGNSTVDSGLPPWTEVAQNTKNKVDILFMIDNSNSMAAMSQELAMRFDQMFKVYQDLAAGGVYADLQIGVVTSDYGAGATGAPGCQPSPGGQQGKLQTIGVNAPNGCQGPMGSNFIKYDFHSSSTNVPMNQDVVQTFQCMAAVGASGCGFEHQLESAYAALHNNLPENAGFLRDDALLVVVFLTNEDDSSAPTDADMFDKNKTAQYGYEDSFRSTRFGVSCAGSLPPYGDSFGPLANCVPAPNVDGAGPGKEYDVSRYINFFTRPAVQGGVKIDPKDVVLIAIDAPSDPFQVILSNPGTAGGQPFLICDMLNEQSNPPCVPVLQHSCQNPNQPVFFGDPAVRLNTVVNAAANHQIFSICDDDYTAALTGAANLIVSNIGAGCVAYPLANPGAPTCVVEDVTINQDGTTTTTPLGQCPGPFPCWRLEAKQLCDGISPQGVGLTVDRNGQAAPDNTVTRFYCM